MDWNAADTSEVSSPNPVGPSQVAQSIHALQVAVLNASKVTEVHLPRLNAFFFYNQSQIYIIPSPRDSGRVVDAQPSKDHSA